jgi:hypothetical protein
VILLKIKSGNGVVMVMGTFGKPNINTRPPLRKERNTASKIGAPEHYRTEKER